MKEFNYKVDINSIRYITESNFIKMCGGAQSSLTNINLLKGGMELKECFFQSIHVEANVVKLVNEENDRYSCNIPREYIDGACVFTITLGEVEIKKELKPIELMYLDMWGTSCLNAAINYIRKITSHSKYLSPVYGPGYFKIPIDLCRTIYKDTNAEKIGVTINEYDVIHPEKTICGYYFMLNSNNIEYMDKCIDCIGDKAGCLFCLAD